MYLRFLKLIDTLAYLSLIVLTWRLIDDELPWKLAIAATVVSGAWLVVTGLRVGHLLKTYFDTLSRLEVTVPVVLGSTLAILAILGTHHWATRSVAALELLGWAFVYRMYRRNRAHYERQGHGPVPLGCWVSPPAEVLQAGDLLLTSGRVAKRLHESVGHGEIVLEDPGGAKRAFSSFMDKGAVLDDLERYTTDVRAHGHYIAMRPREPLTPEDVRRATEIAEQMLEDNALWRERTNARRRRIIDGLPLPRSTKDRLIAVSRATGYDWLGLFMGRLAPHRWTCIGACLEIYEQLGVPTNRYGTGLLGFGTTLFDPIMPVRFLSDPALRVLTDSDRSFSESAEGGAA